MTPKNWDEIDLGGLTMEGSGDDDNSTADKKQRRLHERMDISNLLGVAIDKIDNIPVNVITHIMTKDVDQKFKATIQDISEGGIRILSEGLSYVNDILNLNFSIGKRNITVRGIVRWVVTDKGKDVLGIEFINLNQNDSEFLSSIHILLQRTLKRSPLPK
ncbi:MAG: PilZ domain-containing protein [Proteobacteria bacterium]|nr:PilZ domain-containing protein [Pseudomonadota bacterium]